MIRDFFRGARYLFKGFELLSARELRKFILIPLSINVFLFSMALILGSWQVDGLIDQFIPEGWSWLQWLIWPVFFLLMLVVGFYSFTLIANFIASPFNSILSARVELRQTGELPPSTGRNWHQEIRIALGNEVRKWAHYLKWIILLVILSFIPVVNFLTPVFWFVLGSWMLAVEYTDYCMGNHGSTLSQQIPWLKDRLPLVMGFGAATLAATLIPILNFAVMPAAVVAGTLLWLDQRP